MTSNSPDWDAIIRQIDAQSAAAAHRDVASRRIAMDDIAGGFAELAKLRHGTEPDYAARGLGTAYLLYYLAKRAVNAAIACAALGNLPQHVRVLDIGAGTNAAALALSAIFQGTHFSIAAIEPSEEMAAAGESAVAGLANVTLDHVPATLEAVLDQDSLPGEIFDLVMMSAMLPYEWTKNTQVERIEFGERLLSRVRPGGRVVVIEPFAKRSEITELARLLERVGMAGSTVERADIGGLVLWDWPLPRCTELLKRWYAGLSISVRLTREADEMIGQGKWFGLGLGGRSPDLILVASRPFGPSSPRPRPPQAIVRLPQLKSQAMAVTPGRTRVTTSLRMRERALWGLGATAAVAAIAIGVMFLV